MELRGGAKVIVPQIGGYQERINIQVPGDALCDECVVLREGGKVVVAVVAAQARSGWWILGSKL